jgi:hypothetical protein
LVKDTIVTIVAADDRRCLLRRNVVTPACVVEAD